MEQNGRSLERQFWIEIYTMVQEKYYPLEFFDYVTYDETLEGYMFIDSDTGDKRILSYNEMTELQRVYNRQKNLIRKKAFG